MLTLNDFSPESRQSIEDSLKSKVSKPLTVNDFAPQSKASIQQSLQGMGQSVQNTGHQVDQSAHVVGKAISQSPYYQVAVDAAKRHGIDPDLFTRQIQQESGFNPKALSSANAQGIAQIVPKWHPGVDPWDPTGALDYAAGLMASGVQKYGSYQRALSAYNSGKPDAYKDPNFAKGQTYNYVKAITGGAPISAQSNYRADNWQPTKFNLVKPNSQDFSKLNLSTNPDGTLKDTSPKPRNYVAEWNQANKPLSDANAKALQLSKQDVALPSSGEQLQDFPMKEILQLASEKPPQVPQAQPVAPPPTNETNFFGDLGNNFLNAASGYSLDQKVKESGHGVGATIGNVGGQLTDIIGASLGGAGLGSVVPGVGTAAGAFTGGAGASAVLGSRQEAQRERLAGEPVAPDKQFGAGAINLGLQLLPILRGANLAKTVLKNAGTQGAIAGVADIGQQAIEQGTIHPKIDWNRVGKSAQFGLVSGGLAGKMGHAAMIKENAGHEPTATINFAGDRSPINRSSSGLDLGAGETVLRPQGIPARMAGAIQSKVHDITGINFKPREGMPGPAPAPGVNLDQPMNLAPTETRQVMPQGPEPVSPATNPEAAAPIHSTDAAVFTPPGVDEAALIQKLTGKGDTQILTAQEALQSIKQKQSLGLIEPERAAKESNILNLFMEAGRNGEAITLQRRELKEGLGTLSEAMGKNAIKNREELSPVAITQHMRSAQTEVSNLVKELGSPKAAQGRLREIAGQFGITPTTANFGKDPIRSNAIQIAKQLLADPQASQHFNDTYLTLHNFKTGGAGDLRSYPLRTVEQAQIAGKTAAVGDNVIQMEYHTLQRIANHPEVSPELKANIQKIQEAPSISAAHIKTMKALLKDTRQLRVFCNLFGLV